MKPKLSPEEKAYQNARSKHQTQANLKVIYRMRRVILTVCVVLLVAIFTGQNATVVPIQFLVWRVVEAPLAVVLLVVLFLGMALGSLAVPLIFYKRPFARKPPSRSDRRSNPDAQK